MWKLISFTFLLSIWNIFGITENFEAELHGEQNNIIMIMFDDLGRSDLGSFGAEWETPNIDSFLRDSIVLSHHYIGYVCSASRSQFLTGRYSYHNGYGTLNVFDIEKLGALPLSTPTFVEYLSTYGNYNTYGIGKWQLGSPTYENMAANRGFDHFWGFNGGMEDYRAKTKSIPEIAEHRDFFYNLEPISDWDGGYSTDQYIDKAIDIIGVQSKKSENENNDPFFMYIGFQAIHFPFSEDTPYYEVCQKTALPDIDINLNEDRMGVCESILGVDYQLGRLLEYFQSTDELKKVWENTVIILTSDNGGDIDEGSCNYPLRGGKNTFFEGGQRVIAAVGGGVIPDEQRGIVLDGLFSNVDWFPTILSFANLIPKNSKHVLFGDDEQILKIKNFYENSNQKEMEVEDTALVLDGYNMYEYIMTPNSNGIRDHILLHIKPKSKADAIDDANENSDDDDDSDSESVVSSAEDTTLLFKSITEYELDDFREIAMLFYDENGVLWKYFDVSKSNNPIGNPGINSGWCTKTSVVDQYASFEYTDNNEDDSSTISLNAKYSNVMDNTLTDDYLKTALFDITNDIDESNNYLTEDDDDSVIPDNLLTILTSKLDYYVNKRKKIVGSLNSNTMYGDFKCFTLDDTGTAELACIQKGDEMNAWVPFYTKNEWFDKIIDLCSISSTHAIYKLFTGELILPDTLDSTDNSDVVENLNENVPSNSGSQRRKFDEIVSKSGVDDLNAKDDISDYHNKNNINNKHHSNKIIPAVEYNDNNINLNDKSANDSLNTTYFVILGFVLILMGFAVLLYQHFRETFWPSMAKVITDKHANIRGEYISLE